MNGRDSDLCRRLAVALARDLPAWAGSPLAPLRDTGPAGGEAALVDLAKCRYSHPPLDLAHATLYTSTSWHLDHRATLTAAEVASAYAAWAAALGEPAAQWLDWQMPLRRAMWLWSVTWCAKWRVASRRPAAVDVAEEGSAARIAAGLVEHVRGRVDHYLLAEGIERVLSEFDALAGLLPSAGARR